MTGLHPHPQPLPVPPRGLGGDHDLPLHARLTEALRQQITQATVQGADQPLRIPSEAALTRQYGVSRITVRQALDALARQGLIVKIAGKGSFAVRPRQRQPVQQLARLQGLAEAMAPQGLVVHNQVLAQQVHKADAEQAAALGLPEGAPLMHIRRLRLLDGAPISVDATWLPLAIGQRLDPQALPQRDIFSLLEDELALPLAHADLVIDAVPAPLGIAELLQLPAGHPVLHIRRTTFTRDGRAIDHEHLHCRTDRLQLQLRAERSQISNHRSSHSSSHRSSPSGSTPPLQD